MPAMFRPLEFFVGSRYVWSRRRRGLVSFMSAASLCGVALGVASLIIVLSIMNGLETETRDRLLSMNSHATFAAADDGIIRWEDRAEVLDAFPGIEHVAPFVSIEGMLAVGDRLYPSLIRGVDPVIEADVFPEENMVEGSFIDLAAAVAGEISR